ncbi:hypothetical protein PENSPDRAFT_650226 [Peniophora sp. CONT]|nr:hypothetical protein PENSPDRAFT_650226 [Peniophora sp. CONT]
MSANQTNGKRTFLARCPVHTDEGSFARRMSVRPAHIEGIKKHVAGGYLKFAGFTLTTESADKPVEEQVVDASNMAFLADNIDEVWGYIKADPFWENNVWIKEKTTVLPIVISVQSA